MASLVGMPGPDGPGRSRPSTSVLDAAVDELVRLAADIKQGVAGENFMFALTALSGLGPVEHHLGSQIQMRMMAAEEPDDESESDTAAGNFGAGIYL